ncbi:MAG TPA: DHA2 family efflux MFS transporter permease subunit [Acidimicrobiia bacterium]
MAADEPVVAVRHRSLALVVVCFAIFISTVDATVVNVALPDISADLGATTAELQWVMDSYTIALAGLVLLGGGLADHFGRKRVFCLGLALFAATSLLATFASSPPALITYRAGMGIAAALIFPPALSLIAVIFPPKERRRAIAIWSLVAGIGVAMGPVIGGALIDSFWWGSAFLVNVPVTLGGLVGAIVLLPESRRPGAPRLDMIGAVLSVLALAGVVYAVIEGPHSGWTEPDIVAGLAIGLLALAGFVSHELRHPDPLFDVRVLAKPVVLAGFVTLLLFYVAFFGVEFVVPQYLQSVEGRSAIAAGLLMLTVGVLNPPASLLTPRLMERFGPGRLLVASLSGVGAGAFVVSLLGVLSGTLVVVLGLLLIGACLGLGFPPATAAVMNALPVEKAGDGSAVNQVGRQVGAALGIALIGSVLAGVYSSEVGPATTRLTDAQAQAADSSIEGAQTAAGELSGSRATALVDAADDAFERASQVSLWTITGVGIAGALFVFVLLRGSPAMRPIAPGSDS